MQDCCFDWSLDPPHWHWKVLLPTRWETHWWSLRASSNWRSGVRGTSGSGETTDFVQKNDPLSYLSTRLKHILVVK